MKKSKLQDENPLKCFGTNSKRKGRKNNLSARRGKDKFHFLNVWVCAAGDGIEEGETPEEAMKREMREEIGISNEIEEIGKVSYESEERDEILHIFTTSGPLGKINFTPDKREIHFLKEFSIEEVLQKIKNNPEEFAPTFIEVFLEFARPNQKN